MFARSRVTTLRWATTGIAARRALIRQQPFSVSTRLRDEQCNNENPYHWSRLSRFWLPTGGVTSASDGKQDDATALLVKAGFIRQAHSGVYHYLPMAEATERVLKEAIEAHLKMELNASQVSLSSLSSEDLWRKSGRIGEKPLAETEHQFLAVKDRRDSHLILAPTHEEEITTLVANNAKSYKDFPLRLFQVGRKYRDELRPRHGLLRTKEFMMKDLYTFDISEPKAIETYNKVREVYRRFFKRLGLPVVEARASSGDMGGDLSHEFHILNEAGEDTIHICSSCGFAENSEVSSKPADTDISNHACPKCQQNTLGEHNAIEIGHTFHLGTRYSEPLGAMVEVPQPPTSDASAPVPTTARVPLQMGCHGIGISRLIGAAAAHFKDPKGLRWPLNMSPITGLVLVEGDGASVPGLALVMAALNQTFRDEYGYVFRSRVWLDDRPKSLGWKLRDAELVGYPFVLVLGKKFLEEGTYEFQCRWDGKLNETSADLTGTLLGMLNAMEPERRELGKGNMWKMHPQARERGGAARKAHPTGHTVEMVAPLETGEIGVRQQEWKKMTQEEKQIVRRGSLSVKMDSGSDGDAAQRDVVRKVNVPDADYSETSSGRYQSRLKHKEHQLQRARDHQGKRIRSPEDIEKRSQRSRDYWQRVRADKAKAGELRMASAASPSEAVQSSESAAMDTAALKREQLAEKVRLLQRLLAIQDAEKKLKKED